jgi:2-oxoglutarate ferredoxin oxidoreductase subunit gamma
MELKIILAGFGGQGILSAGKIVAEAGLIEGREVSWFPSYGPEMRGGTANCGVIISDRPIGSPVLDACDVLIALNAPSLRKFESRLAAGGTVIVDRSLVPDDPTRSDIAFFPLEASRVASDRGNMAFATVMLLGCLSAATGCFSRDSFEQALRLTLPERHRHLIPVELEIFDLGAAAVR